VFLELARKFLDWGVPVRLILFRREGAYLSHVDPRCPVEVLGGRDRLTCVLRLAQYLRRSPPALLLCGVDIANPIALLARQLDGGRVPVVTSNHTPLAAFLAERSRAMQWLYLRLMRLLSPSAVARIAVSEAVAQDMVRLLGLPRDSITLIRNPVDIAAVERAESSPVPDPWLEPDQIAQVPAFVAAGRLSPEKDHAALFRALARLSEDREVRLILLGEGPERVRLEREASRLGLAARIKLTGFVSNPFTYFVRASVFVLSSRYEGFGNVLVEAMACGCPVVSTDCPGGPSEILLGGRLGPLVAPGDDAALARAMAAMLDAPTPAAELRARAAEFALDRVAGTYLELLSRVSASAILPNARPDPLDVATVKTHFTKN